MGMKQLPKRSGEFLFEIIMRRYELKSTMMTSNRPFEDWGKLMADVPAATAILDRFLHHAELINITGKSYRLRHRDTNGAPPTAKSETTNSNDIETPEESNDEIQNQPQAPHRVYRSKPATSAHRVPDKIEVILASNDKR